MSLHRTTREPAARTLILLRHGKSAYPPGVQDHERPLAARGSTEAALAGSWIRDNLPLIDRVVCSTATRTRQTLAASGLGSGARVSYTSAVYEAYPEELIELLTTLPVQDRTVLLVGHGPGLPALAEQLAGRGSDSAALDRVRKKFPTSAIAVVAVDRDWSQLESGRTRLIDFVVPRDKGRTEARASVSQVIEFGGATPDIDPTAWLAPTATVIGRVTVGAATGVFYGAVVRGDSSTIAIGSGSNLQDGVVVHADPDFPATIGSGVSVGHAAVLHGCTVQDDCLIGMGAVVLNGAVIGAGSMVAAGAVVLEGAQIPPGSLVAGVPGKVRRELTADEREHLSRNAAHYVELTAGHRAATG
jgi:carbonic anhydrase/acetyltransferase-like protein (isoleucine patch superfamily)/phosphohistidine phosphatase SixA